MKKKHLSGAILLLTFFCLTKSISAETSAPAFPVPSQNKEQDSLSQQKKARKEKKEDRKETRKNTKEHLKSEIDDQRQELKENIQEAKEATKEKFNQAKEGISNWFNENIKANTVGDFAEIQRQNNQNFANYLRSEWVEYPIQIRERKTLSDGSFFSDRKATQPKADTALPRQIRVESLIETIPVLSPPVPETYYQGAGNDAISKLLTKQFVTVKFYGQNLHLYYVSSIRSIGLGKGQEKNVAKFWQYLSEQDFNSVLFQLYQHKEQLGLNDYQYYRLVKQFADQLFAKGKNGESLAFTVFILNQTGYDARMARLQTEKGDRMILLLPIFEEISGTPYITIGNNDYYMADLNLTRKERQSTVLVYEKAYATATHPFSIRILPEKLKLPPLYGKFQGYTYNERLAEMEADLPNGPLPLYTTAAFNELLNKTLLYKLKPELDSLVQKKQDENLKTILSEREKQEIKILNLNQFLNRYITSQAKQSARLAGDYLYPDLMFLKKGAGDILDRSVLLCMIANRILDIPAVLLVYPNFAMAAVCLEDTGTSPGSPFFQGDFIEINGKKYFLCGNLPKTVENPGQAKVFKW